MSRSATECHRVSQSVTKCCRVSQSVAECRRVLENLGLTVSIDCRNSFFQDTATHCDKLRHSTTSCDFMEARLYATSLKR